MIQKRSLGNTDTNLAATGLGCMGLSEFYGPPTDKGVAKKLLHEAIDRGVDYFNTAELYGMGENESSLGDAFKDRRDKVFVATKFGKESFSMLEMSTRLDPLSVVAVN